MFSSGSVKVMGGFFAFGAVVMALVGNALRQDENARVAGWVLIGVGVIMAVIASACLIEKGRAVTGRITAAVGCLVCLGIGVVIAISLVSGEDIDGGLVIPLDGEHSLVIRSWWGPIGGIFLIVMMGLGGAYYAVFGRFPSEWTFEELFRGPSSPVRKSKSKSKSAATRMAKKPLRPLDE